jgi:hypothetical protein
MIGGIEAIHTWAGGLILNDRSADPAYKIDSISGRNQSADFDPETDAAIGRIGEVPRTGDREGKTEVIEGRVYATSLDDLRAARADMIAAFSGTDELRMDVTEPAGWLGDPIPPRYYFARALDVAIEDEQGTPHRSSHGWDRPFSLTLRLSDPRYYDPTEVDEADDTPEAMGGAPVPFVPGDRVAGPDAEGFSMVVDNTGNADTPAIMRVRGPANNPVISNVTADNVYLRFKNLPISSGHHIEIDFRRRRAYRSNGQNVRHTLDPASTWWDRNRPCLLPGENELRCRAYSLGETAQFRVMFNPADYS